MRVLVYTGKVIPESSGLTLSTPVVIGWRHPELRLLSRYTLTLKNSKLVIAADAPFFLPSHGSYHYSAVTRLAYTVVDPVAFATGMDLRVHLDQIWHAGQQHELAPQNAHLQSLCNAFSLDDDTYNNVVMLALREPKIAQAFHDLAKTNSESVGVSRDCMRAMERIRQILSLGDISIAEQWVIMRERLRCDRVYLQYITDAARSTRHGDLPNESSALTMEIGRRAWTLMNRFLLLRLRNLEALPEAEFPLLVG